MPHAAPERASSGASGEAHLRHRLSVEEALVEASRRLSAPGDADILSLLELIGSKADLEGLYLQTVPPDHARIEDWAASEEGALALTFWTATSPASRSSSDEEAFEAWLHAEDRDVEAVPLLSGSGTFYGYLGLVYGSETSPWREEDRRILDVLGDALASHYERDWNRKSLRQSEQRWRSLVEEHPEPILIVANETIVYGNPSGLRVFGIASSSDFGGKSILEFVPSEQRELVQDRVLALAYGAVSDPLQHEIIRPDGEWRIVESFGLPVVFQGEKAIQLVLRDLTERKRSEDRYRSFVQTISEGIWRVELDQPVETGWPLDRQVDHLLNSGRVEECNGVMAGFLGASRPDEAIGRPVGVVLQERAMVEEFVRSGYTIEHWEYSAPGPQARHFVLNAVGAIERGHLVRIWGSCIEVTDRVQFERRMVSALEEQQQRIGRELHDGVGQLLTGIRMLSQVLSDHLGASNAADQQVAQKVVLFSEQAAQQVRAIYSGLTPVQLEEDGLSSAIEELVRNTDVSPYLGCEFVEDGNVEIADQDVRLHLYRIVQEAINNALKHAQATRIRVSLAREGNATRLQIQDDGIGFTRRRRIGRSLGLTGMYYRARAIGARLDVISSPGEGTTIRCYVPSPSEVLERA